MEPILASHLEYDIPKPDGKDVFPNPSPELRRLGFRTTGSGWVVPTALLPHHLIVRMRDAGCRVRIFKYDASEADSLRETCREMLRELALADCNSVQAKSDEATEAAGESVGEGTDGEKAAKSAAAKVRARAKVVEKLLGDYEQAAANFGLTAEDIGIDGCRSQVRIIQTVALSRSRAYVKACEIAKRSSADGHGLAMAAENGESIHPGIIADALRDAGKEAEADELMEMFQQVA